MAVAAATGLLLAGCVTGTPGAAVTTAPPATAWTLEPSAGASAGSTAFNAHDSAAQNRAAFDAAITSVLKGNPDSDGPAVAAALQKAGFPMAATQLSASKTSADLQPGSISVGVKVGANCLIGQWGNAVAGYHSSVEPALGSGGCLIGGIAPVG